MPETVMTLPPTERLAGAQVVLDNFASYCAAMGMAAISDVDRALIALEDYCQADDEIKGTDPVLPRLISVGDPTFPGQGIDYKEVAALMNRDIGNAPTPGERGAMMLGVSRLLVFYATVYQTAIRARGEELPFSMHDLNKGCEEIMLHFSRLPVTASR